MTDSQTAEQRQLNTAVIETPPAEVAPARIGFRATAPEMDAARVARQTKYLVNEAFQQSPMGIAYYLSQRIAEMFPCKAIVEIQQTAFDAVRFASAGNCRMKLRPAPHPHWILHWWEEKGHRLGKAQNQLWQGWYDIEWEDHALEVINVVWVGSHNSHVRHSLVIADKRKTAVRFIHEVCAWNCRPRNELLVYDGDDWRKDEDMFRAIKGASFENLVLPGSMGEQMIADVAGFFEARELYERYAVPWRRGILFVGPPGNGKTHTVKALVNRLSERCLYVKSFRGRGGASEYSIGEVFAKARACAPCVLVLEDLDSLVTDRSRSYFLNELDGFADNAGILTLATTNHPERLDPAIADRPSRFDRKYHFELPQLAERGTFLLKWNAALDPDMRVDEAVIAEVAEFTAGFSFAYLKELCLASVMAWMAARPDGAMARITREQVESLRKQMRSKKGS